MTRGGRKSEVGGRIHGPGLGGWITIGLMLPVLFLGAAAWWLFEIAFRSAPDRPPGYSPIHSKAAARVLFLVVAVAGSTVSAHARLGAAPAPLLSLVEPVPLAGAAPGSVAAAAEVDGDFLLKLIAGLSILGNIGALLAKLRGGGEKRELINNPLRVVAADSFAAQDDFDKHCDEDREEHKEVRALILREIGGVYDRVEKTREQILKAGSDRESTLRHDIQKLVNLVGELRGQVGEISKRIK